MVDKERQIDLNLEATSETTSLEDIVTCLINLPQVVFINHDSNRIKHYHGASNWVWDKCARWKKQKVLRTVIHVCSIQGLDMWGKWGGKDGHNNGLGTPSFSRSEAQAEEWQLKKG